MVKAITIHEALVKELINYIRVNNLKSGDRLPNQQELCNLFGISRTSLRESLRTLYTMGIIEVFNGKGIFVKDKSVLKLDTEVDIDNKKKSLIEMLEIRRVLEGLAIKLAAQRATQQDIEIMDAYLAVMIEKNNSNSSCPEEDKSFHKAIYHVSNNKILIDLLNNCYEIFSELWSNPLDIGAAMNEIDLHIQVLDGIKKHDPNQSGKAFQRLMDREEKMILSR